VLLLGGLGVQVKIYGLVVHAKDGVLKFSRFFNVPRIGKRNLLVLSGLLMEGYDVFKRGA
jgi:hypothetical protein